MFGRKQPAFTFDNNRAHDEHQFKSQADIPPVNAAPKPAGPEHIDLPFGEPAAEAPSRPARPTTARPDPTTLFRGSEEPQSSSVSSPLLQLGSAETVDDVAPSAAPAPKRRAGRAKTRLLGFEPSEGQVEDVLGKQEQQMASAPLTYNAVGWLVVVDGPGRGHSMPLRSGVSQIGRGDDQTVQLDFGDTSISRENHASIAFDDEQREFFIGHGGKANLVRLNGAPVLSTQALSHHDKVRIGETTLQLIAFCGKDFVWSEAGPQDATTETVPGEGA